MPEIWAATRDGTIRASYSLHTKRIDMKKKACQNTWSFWMYLSVLSPLQPSHPHPESSPTSASPHLSLASAEVRLYTFFTQLAAPSITSLAQPQVAFTALILTATGFSRFTATWPQTEGGGLCSREGKTAPKTSTWAGVSTKWALEIWPASSGWDLTRSIAWRQADRASCEWRWETGAEAGLMPNMAVLALVMSSRCTSWVWARIQARRETRWQGTTTWSSAPRTGIMIRVVTWTVLCCTQAPGGTRVVSTPTWTGSTWGRTGRESPGITTPSPWSLQRWSCTQQTNFIARIWIPPGRATHTNTCARFMGISIPRTGVEGPGTSYKRPGAETGRMTNMAVSALVMSSRCTGWVWARIQARRETRWRFTTKWSSAPRTRTMIRVVEGNVLWTAQAPGGTGSVTAGTSPTWTGSTWGTRWISRESAGSTTKTAISPWSLQRWSCTQQTNLPSSGFLQVGMTQLTHTLGYFSAPWRTT